MRTTLTLDDDVILAVRDLARRQGRTMGRGVSDLLRQALTARGSMLATRNGIALLPYREGAGPVTLEMVNRLREELD